MDQKKKNIISGSWQKKKEHYKWINQENKQEHCKGCIHENPFALCVSNCPFACRISILSYFRLTCTCPGLRHQSFLPRLYLLFSPVFSFISDEKSYFSLKSLSFNFFSFFLPFFWSTFFLTLYKQHRCSGLVPIFLFWSMASCLSEKAFFLSGSKTNPFSNGTEKFHSAQVHPILVGITWLLRKKEKKREIHTHPPTHTLNKHGKEGRREGRGRKEGK